MPAVWRDAAGEAAAYAVVGCCDIGSAGKLLPRPLAAMAGATKESIKYLLRRRFR